MASIKFHAGTYIVPSNEGGSGDVTEFHKPFTKKFIREQLDSRWKYEILDQRHYHSFIYIGSYHITGKVEALLF